MQVIEAIIKWSERLPNWQSDALRRLWTQEAYSDSDFDATLSALKQEHGLEIKEPTALQPLPFTHDHVSARSESGNETILLGMHSLKKVNALAADQRLRFGSKGITVIYGENASGKSGYSRVLKRACRARGTKDPVHPDVFAGSPPSGPAEALFDINVGDTPDTVKWTENSVPPDALGDIAVFDSKCARVYVDEANDVAYIPYGLDVLGHLAKVCERLRKTLRDEIARLPEPPKILDDLVGEGKPLPRLTAQTPTDEIGRTAVFTEADAKRLSDTTRHLAELVASDPKKKAEEWRRRRQRIDRFRKDILTLKRAVSRKSVQRLSAVQKGAVAAQEAAKLASERAFAHEPLSGTGSDAWRIMFEAARRFSEESAYPEQPFPVTGDGSRCVLCQQPLEAESKDRLKRFWDFLQADTARTAARHRKELSEAIDKFDQLDFEIESRHQGLLEEISELEPGADVTARPYLNSLASRANAVSKAVASGKWSALSALSDDPWSILSRASKRCQCEAEQFDKAASEDQKPTVEREKAALELRKLLAENKDVLTQHVGALQHGAALERCFTTADTTGITRKQSELMSQALTKELKTALDAERTELAIRYIPIKLKRTGAVGTTRHKLTLNSPAYQRAGLSEILSEGEHRMLAIASFLAELSTSEHRCGIVFDDPVSSLDHKWREQVARRLVKEGNERQVIIFTHDIEFFFAVQEEAAIQQIPLTIQSVLRDGNSVGVTDPDVPWHVMNVAKRIGFLRNMLQRLTAQHRHGNLAAYADNVESFYGRLRKSWEKAVEEVLLGRVVQRFRNEVQTQRLHSVEVTNEDYRLVYWEVKRCSRAVHDAPPGSMPSIPTPDTLAADLQRLDRFVKDLQERQKRLESDRRKLHEAPRPS